MALKVIRLVCNFTLKPPETPLFLTVITTNTVFVCFFKSDVTFDMIKHYMHSEHFV